MSNPGGEQAGPVGSGGRRSRRSPRDLWHEWRTDPVDRFGVLLVVVVATIVVSALVDVSGSWRGSLAVSATSGLAVLAAARSVGLRPRLQRLAAALVAGVLILNIVLAVLEVVWNVDPPAQHHIGLLWLAVLLVVPVLVIRRILVHSVVAMRTVIGAISAYLQIAVAYSVLFQAIDGWSSTPFFGSPQPSTAYMYVSLTTISTLGIGDLAPFGPVARLALSSEAVLGQVFLVTVVAVVVTRFAESRRGG